MDKYRLHGEDDNAYTIAHPDGTTFKIAKHGLSEHLHQKIRHMYDGGVTAASAMPQEDTPEAIQESAAQTDPNQPYQSLFMNQKDLEQKLNPGEPENFAEQTALNVATGQKRADQFQKDEADRSAALDYQHQVAQNKAMNDQRSTIGLAPVAAPPVPDGFQQQAPAAPDTSVASQAAPQPQGGNGFPGMGDYQGLLNRQTAAFDTIGKANKAQADAQAEAYKQNIAATQAEALKFQNDTAKISQDLDRSAQIIQSTNIDPNRLWHDASIGGQVAAGIGLILGGIGAGLAGGPNQAAKMMNTLVERDIDAQKANLNKQQTLYSDNLQRYRNAEMADTATRLQLGAVLQGQIGKAAAQSGSQQAMAQADLMKVHAQAEMYPLVQRFAAMQIKQKAMNGGLSPAEDNVLSMVDPAWSKQSVPVNGKVLPARSEKDAQDMKDMESHFVPIQNELNFIKILGPGAMVDPNTRARAQASMARVGMMINEFNGYKRFTEIDENTIKHQFNDPTNWKTLFTGTGATADTIKSLQQRMDKERSEKLMGYQGIDSLKTRKPGWQPAK